MEIKRINSEAEMAGVQPVAIACNNWSGYPDEPKTEVKVARHGDSLVIEYRVDESNPRAVCVEDHQNVWEDSCVEFFCAVPGEDRYINFEFNSRGVGLACKRKDRNACKEPFGAEKMARIIRKADVQPDQWTLQLTIPLDLISPIAKDQDAIKCNFYKCGDCTAAPHFLSWAPIKTEKPDFHRPEFFATATMA